MKRLLCSVLILLGLLIASPPAHAQAVPGLYSFLSGGTSQLYQNTTNQSIVAGVTNNWGAPGTSTNWVMNVSQCDYAGFTFTATGVSAQTTNVSVALYKSFDNGNSYEALPTFSYTNINIGAATYTTNAALDIHGVTHLALRTSVLGTAGTTNTFITLNLKAPAIYSTPPGNYGKTPGTPIAVPNFP
jgi:hypothetical protein